MGGERPRARNCSRQRGTLELKKAVQRAEVAFEGLADGRGCRVCHGWT